MIITYFRSSSYNAWDMCPQQYFLEYVLGWKGPANIKADKGTIVHKILEILAKIKLTLQSKPTMFFKDTEVGPFIEDECVGIINCTNFDTHTICEKVFNYYAKAKAQPWTNKDFADCKLWVNKVIDFNDGAFNPLKMNIVAPEQHFDIQINEPWATYDYIIDGKKVSGCLALKGTIDLITSPSPGIYEIVDWKTGRRLNWATGEEKTHDKLRKDPQLMLYYLAASYIYPDVEQILVTINFINDGGPFSMCYTKDDIPEALEMLRVRFEEIKACKVPKLNKSWKCNKFCHFGLTTFDNSAIKPLQEFRSGQTCSKGQMMTKCEQIKFEIERKGMDKVIKEYTKEDHSVGMYANPGEI